MQLIRHLADVAAPDAGRPRVLAVGVFDGMHLGHQRLLARLAERAGNQDGEAMVALRRPPSQPAPLMSLRSRLAALAERRIDRVVCLGEHQLADDGMAASALGAVVLVTGHRLGGAPRCEVEEIEAVRLDGARLDTDGVRAALQAGDLAATRARLGRDPVVEGRIVHGFHRGAPLGIPTANLRIRDLALPPDGVYAVRARLAGRALNGVANIGFNPTFGNRVRSVETHLFDFSGDVYGQRLAIALVARLRGEQKFAGVEALLTQIRADIAAARSLLTHGG
jgi:riboflavin kinase / FMN adenylyltransferase